MPVGVIGNTALNHMGGPTGGAQLLPPSGFANAIASGRVVVEFFNYGCPYCKAAMPKVHKTADELSDKGVKVFMMSLGSPEAQALCGQYAPGYLPAFAVFDNGQHKGSFNREGSDPVTDTFVKSKITKLLKLG